MHANILYILFTHLLLQLKKNAITAAPMKIGFHEMHWGSINLFTSYGTNAKTLFR